MLSINTNLSSLIAQQSMTSATNKLNQAIERMTTGYKINGAKDNAANYSISQNMQTQLGSYDVAADNVAMGMDLVTTASDIINSMQDKATRLQALCTQARNGTYGQQSMSAINSEAGAIMAEITRLYQTAEYNNVSLFNREAYTIADHLPQAKAEYNGFIEDPKTYTDEEVAAMTRVKDVSTFTSGEKYAIYTKEELVKLADSVNGGNKMEDVEFVLGADIDLSSISNWTPIGTSTNPFRGIFDGNGHTISNLTINNPTAINQGLFGYVDSDDWDWKTISIKNVALKNVDIKGGSNVGALLGHAAPYGENWFKISNCYSTGNIEGTSNIGGLVGTEAHHGCDVDMTYNNLYSECNVTGKDSVGGIIGLVQSEGNYAMFENLFSTGNIIGENCVGGIVGEIYSLQDALGYSKSYATGNIVGNSYVGGLIGKIEVNDSVETEIQDSASYSKTISGNSNVGSIVGSFNGESKPWGTIYNETLVIENCQTVLNKQALGVYYILDDTSNSLVVDTDYDLSVFDLGVSAVELKGVLTSLQVGINSNLSCQINFDTNFKFDLSALEGNIASDEALSAIMEFSNLLSEKSTQLGAVQNRLDSALESITVNMENLTSSLSTIRDADIAEVSSTYIQQQILQQASATLLATANQNPSIALQLI